MEKILSYTYLKNEDEIKKYFNRNKDYEMVQSFIIQIRNYMLFFINGKINNEFNKIKEK